MLDKLCPELFFCLCSFLQYRDRVKLFCINKFLAQCWIANKEEKLFLDNVHELSTWDKIFEIIHMFYFCRRKQKFTSFDYVLVEVIKEYWPFNPAVSHFILTHYSFFLANANLPFTKRYLTYNFRPDKQIDEMGQNTTTLGGNIFTTKIMYAHLAKLEFNFCACQKKIQNEIAEYYKNLDLEKLFDKIKLRLICNFYIWDRNIFRKKLFSLNKYFAEPDDYDQWLSNIILLKLVKRGHYCKLDGNFGDSLNAYDEVLKISI